MNTVPNDGWLGKLHTILLMDDTAVLTTTRESMMSKLTLLNAAAGDIIIMCMHPSKSRFIAVNCVDIQPFNMGDITIEPTSEYVYLGTPILKIP